MSHEALRLFCLPCAGSTAATFARYKPLLGPEVRVVPVELPGRGRRFAEPLCREMSELVDATYETLRPELGAGPFAFFGHSMGALVVYELVEKIRREGALVPVHAFLSGRNPPTDSITPGIHGLSDAALGRLVLEWGGISPQLAANRSFMEMFIPILRADLELVQGYLRRARSFHRLPCALSILNGEEDQVVRLDQMAGWADLTTESCSFHRLPDGHSFVESRVEAVATILRKVLGRAGDRSNPVSVPKPTHPNPMNRTG